MVGFRDDELALLERVAEGRPLAAVIRETVVRALERRQRREGERS
jgi:hypothetical protein